MTSRDNSIRVPLRLLATPISCRTRRAEPVTLGVPLPRGVVPSADVLRLLGDDGSVRPLQAGALDLWADGSVRWALLDFSADVTDGVLAAVVLATGEGLPTARPSQQVRVLETAEALEVDTTAARFVIRRGDAFPFGGLVASGSPALDCEASGLRLGHRGATVRVAVSGFDVRSRGPLRAEIDVRAAPLARRLPLEIGARLEFFAGSATVRATITIRNTRRARHPGGIWELGDPGSVLLDFASLVLALPGQAAGVRVAAEVGASLATVNLPFEIYQDSSGGEQWNHRTHANRNGVVPIALRGYRLRSAAEERTGFRASPVVEAETDGSTIAVAVPCFWENFPRAITVEDRTIEVGLFPHQFADVHELQGGEQKTHVVVISFGADAVSAPTLAWCHDPLRLYPAPDYCCSTEAVPFLTPSSSDDAAYAELVQVALDPERGFFAKRERFDEYGWRHFGDIAGDHESAFQPPNRPFVSHYNNQYDAVAAFAMHFLRSGDARWWRLMDDLAHHAVDVDVYHTREDKAAYNGGLFWHTQHYVDAGQSTHRTYPRGTGGGGPAAEHNYNLGLMLHHFMTGDPASREAAIGLARWVIDMDDGRLTPFRWLSSGPTGYASAAGSMDYHGPGRGAANSIIACLVGGRLTGDAVFRSKANELIRRCIHPADDITARNLFDVERRWYYTVFLQALAAYLHEKDERNEFDEMYAYARESLLHYGRWMAANERPYLDCPERLEFPTETWIAQDLRKADVLALAARYAGVASGTPLGDRSRFFRERSLAALVQAPTRHYTRPLVIALRHTPCRVEGGGWREGPPATPPSWPISRFTPQKAIALRRGKRLAMVVAALAAILLLLLTA